MTRRETPGKKQLLIRLLDEIDAALRLHATHSGEISRQVELALLRAPLGDIPLVTTSGSGNRATREIKNAVHVSVAIPLVQNAKDAAAARGCSVNALINAALAHSFGMALDVVSTAPAEPLTATQFEASLRRMVDSARARIALAAGSEQALLNWRIGRSLLLSAGQEDVDTATRVLATFGDTFKLASVDEMVRFASRFPNERQVQTLAHRLSWAHFRELIKLEDPAARAFYSENCATHSWSPRVLREQIDGLRYQRSALGGAVAAPVTAPASPSPDQLLREPSILALLGFAREWGELSPVTRALLRIETALLEGRFELMLVARAKRIEFGTDAQTLGLLFFSRRDLQLIAIEVHAEAPTAAHLGQMEFFMRWLSKHDAAGTQRPPLGVIAYLGVPETRVICLAMEGELVQEHAEPMPAWVDEIGLVVGRLAETN